MNQINLLCRGEHNTYFGTMDESQYPASGQKTVESCGLVLPGAGEEKWRDAAYLEGLRSQLHPNDPSGWYVMYPFDAGEPDGVRQYRTALDEAGYQNVWMVADIDAAIAYYRSRFDGLERMEKTEGIAVIRTEPDGRLCVTTVYGEVYHTCRCTLTDGEAPEGFFEQCVGQHPIGAVLYCGEKPMPLWLRLQIMAQIAPTFLLEDWKDSCYLTGLQQLVPKLLRCRRMIGTWNDALGDGRDLSVAIAKAYEDLVVRQLKPLSDLGWHFYDALNEWGTKARFYSSTLHRRLRMDTDLIFFRAEELLKQRTHCSGTCRGELAQHMHDQMNLAIRQVLGFFEEKMGPGERFSLAALDRSAMQQRVDGFFTPEIQARLTALLHYHWKRTTDDLQDSWSVRKRRKQLVDWNIIYGSRRGMARKQTANWLNERLDLNRERIIFAREILELVHSQLHDQVCLELEPCFHSRHELLDTIIPSDAFDAEEVFAAYEDVLFRWEPYEPVPDVPYPEEEPAYSGFDPLGCTNPDAGKDWIEEMVEVWD